MITVINSFGVGCEVLVFWYVFGLWDLRLWVKHFRALGSLALGASEFRSILGFRWSFEVSVHYVPGIPKILEGPLQNPCSSHNSNLRNLLELLESPKESPATISRSSLS